ncbi:MAG: DoxX family protein [Alphaproteobacteria bacterium]
MTSDTVAPRGKMYWAGWVVSGLVAAFLAFSASLKFFAPAIVRETLSGLGWPVEYDLLIGVIEAGCVALYIVPQTAVLGALLETALLGAAVATNVRVSNPLFSHELFGVYLGVMVWGGLWLRDSRIRALLPFRQ